MAHTHACNLVHCVFSTKGRAELISDPSRLWQYVGGIARQKQVLLLAAGGTANHLHLLISLPPTMTLAKVVQELKGNTSHSLNERSLRVAGRIQCVQRKPVATQDGGRLHRQTGGTSCEMELRAGVPHAAEEVGSAIRSAFCLWVAFSVVPTGLGFP